MHRYNPATGADNAGLVKGDIITGFAGATVTTQDDLTNSTQYYAVGDTVELTIMRGNPTEGYQEQKVNVTLFTSQGSHEYIRKKLKPAGNYGYRAHTADLRRILGLLNGYNK